MSTILVATEIQNGKLKSINNEVFTAAKQMAAETGHSVTGLFLGDSGLEALAEAAATYGIDHAILVESSQLAKFSPDVHAAAIAQAARQKDAAVILSGATFLSKDLMARVAQALDTGLVQDCVKFSVNGSDITFTRPMYAGKVLADVKVVSKPAMATLRSKSYKPEENPSSPTLEKLDLDLPQPQVVVEAIELASAGKMDVTEADLIVSGGRGLRGPENWHILEALAEALGAATACSRPVSDEGWRPHEEHVGQTGKTVAPDLYIAAGISGAIQHIAGISSSKYIVAINKDPEAPIFKVADYGIVGDVFEVLPRFTEEVKKLQT